MARDMVMYRKGSKMIEGQSGEQPVKMPCAVFVWLGNEQIKNFTIMTGIVIVDPLCKLTICGLKIVSINLRWV